MPAQVWLVVGGEETGGILVREGEDLSSPKAASRLEHGSHVEELELKDERLHFKLAEGKGPETGWVSVRIKGKSLLDRCDPEEELPPRQPGEATLSVTTTLEGKAQGTWQLKVPEDCITVGDWKAGVHDQTLLKDDTVAKFADKLSVRRLFPGGKIGKRLPDDAQLPVVPAQVFVTGPGAIQGAFARGLQDDFGDPSVPAVRRVCVRSSACDALHGGYEETFGGSQIFQKKGTTDGEPMALFRDKDHGGWFFGQSSSSFVSFIMKSDDDASTPQDATWPSDIENITAYDEAAAEADDKLFQDKQFPHADESVGVDLEGQLHAKPQWIPARSLGNGQDMKLFDGIDPTDLLQGQIGDCWLIAAMAGLAEFPEEVEGIFRDRGEHCAGRYVVRLFDHRKGDFVEMPVDEFVPCLQKEWWELEGTPLFARPNGSEMWCVLMEKAMAKLFGSYSSLVANNCGVAFRAFTGCLGNFMWMKPPAAGGAWIKYKIMEKGFDYDPCMQDPDYRVEADNFFKVLEDYDKESYLMSCSLQISHSMEYRRSDGLMEGHAYSLLKVCEVDGQKLLLMRNPWGNDCEWNGAWSDHSDMWQKHPSVKEVLRPSASADGLFYMDWEDFNKTWDMVNVCTKPMRTGAAKTTHLKAASFISSLAKQESKRKPRRVRKVLKPIVRLKAFSSGEDDTEASALPVAEVSAERLLEALLLRLFRELDKSNDGKLQLSEALAGLSKIFGVDSQEFKRGQEVFQALDDVDSTNSGELTRAEFIKAGMDYSSSGQDSSVMASMKAFNASHSLWTAIKSMNIADEAGNIGKEEIAGLLKEAAVQKSQEHSQEVWLQVAAQLIAEKDKDNDGALNLQEWLALMGGMTSLCDSSQKSSKAGLHHNAGQLLQVGKAIQKLKDFSRTNSRTASSGASSRASTSRGEDKAEGTGDVTAPAGKPGMSGQEDQAEGTGSVVAAGGTSNTSGQERPAEGAGSVAVAGAEGDCAAGVLARLTQMGQQLRGLCEGCLAGLRG